MLVHICLVQTLARVSTSQLSIVFFFFNDTATTEIYTLSLHDALPISPCSGRDGRGAAGDAVASRRCAPARRQQPSDQDRKSTRLNSSHGYISYAVFCLKKKNITKSTRILTVMEQTALAYITTEC